MAQVSHSKVSYGTVPRATSVTEQFLCFLAFDGSAVRVGIELSACIFTFFGFKYIFPWTLFGVSASWVPLLSWLASCIVISTVDYRIFARAVSCFKEAKRQDNSGNYSQALDALDNISPSSSAPIRLPAKRFHLMRSRVLTHAGHFERALSELLLAAHEGADDLSYFRQRIELQRTKGDYEAAFGELQAAKQRLKSPSALLLEEAMLTLEERADIKKAKQQFQTVISAPKQMLYGDQSTITIAGAFYAVTMLWTGHAEDGLEALNDAIDRIKVDAYYCDELLPIVSWLVMERAYYLVTHKEPERALGDVLVARQLCQHPTLNKLFAIVKDEFDWRYKITV